jgi:hypothetical protein
VAAGYEAAGFADPLMAFYAIAFDCRVLVTRLDFGPDTLSGIALARLVRYKGLGAQVVFVGREENARKLHRTDAFVPHPVDPKAVTDAVRRAHAAFQSPS